MNKKLITSGAVMLALLATPVFADEGKSKSDDNFGIKLGQIVRFFDRQDQGKQNDNEKKDDQNKNDGKHATSTVNANASVSGTVTAVNGNTITLSGKEGAQYTVNAAGAALSADDRTIVITDIKVGDTLKVQGTLSGTTIVATKVRDTTTAKTDLKAKLANLRAGIVTAVTGSGLTLTRFGTGTTATVTTNASTTVKIHGQATTTSAITPGSIVVVVGSSSTTTPDSITATVIHIIDRGIGFLKHFFHRS